MKISHYLLKTSKTVSDEDKSISAKLLKQGCFIRESVAGRYYFMPIGQRVQQKIMAIIKEEMDATGGQEMVSPILHPLELWKETNRTNTAGFELMKVTDRRGAEFALGGTAEEMFVDLVRKFEISYKDLPFQLYQFSPKFRDEMRARGGLLRVREFIMKDSYSFHRDEDDFKMLYEEMKKVYSRIFARLGLTTSIVESDNGYIGGEYCHEFIMESEIGESKYFVSEKTGYAAHEDVAVFAKENKNNGEALQPLKVVAAKRGPTMEDGVQFHGLPLWQQIKDVLFVDEKGRFILAIIRGDFDVNETKLGHVSGATTLRPATDEEIREVIHSEPGFISPVGIKDLVDKETELIIVVDDSLHTIVNAYGGNNKKDEDLHHINLGRDFVADIEGDIALVQSGYAAPTGADELVERRGIEVGNIFQLGYHYSKLMKDAVYTDADGKQKPYYMGCYGIGVGRTLAAIVEKYHDEKGIMWPAAVAPFKVYLIGLGDGAATAENIYRELIAAGVDVLHDDREKMPGEKFADADLLGLPWRVVVSAKTLAQNAAEVKARASAETTLVPLAELTDFLKAK